MGEIEEKKGDHTGPLGEERKELQSSFIFQAENRQKNDNECQLSRPAEKHLQKKKKKSISTSLNPHLLSVPLRNKDEEE